MTQGFIEADFWDARFQEKEPAYGVYPNDFLVEHINLFQKGDRVLSLAEGEGRNAVFLAKHLCSVLGVDFSAAGRQKALDLAQEVGVKIEYDLADLRNYDMQEAQWDAVVSIFCHLPNQQRPAWFRSIKRALKPGGIFLLESYNKKQLTFDSGGPRSLPHLLSLDELTHAFADFQIVTACEIEREIHEGSYHKGLSSVTQFIARRPC